LRPHPEKRIPMNGQEPTGKRDRGSLVVIGGGAAGVFCAVNAARLSPGLDVTLIEKGSRLLAKVLVSGGGRCNVTHDCDDISEMSACYPRGSRFVRRAFHGFFTHDTVEWFSSRGVDTVTEADGRMFPASNTSETIIRCLLSEAERYGVRFRSGMDVREIQASRQGFTIRTADGQELRADCLCIACGGLPKRSQYDWITALGHGLVDPVPSLFTLNIPEDPVTALAGISVPDAAVLVPGTKLRSRGPVLVTHWGLSGPAVLRLSAFGARDFHAFGYQFPVLVNWCPSLEAGQVRKALSDRRVESGMSTVHAHACFGLPLRLWQHLADKAGISRETRWSGIGEAGLSALTGAVNGHRFEVKGKTTFKEEFVTAGGIPTSEIDPSTMQSRLVPRLYFAGEVMDVDGITGGYNFQHAWTSGFLAATHIAASCAQP
jgi:predicted Rossmann fold flavoprotein